MSSSSGSGNGMKIGFLLLILGAAGGGYYLYTSKLKAKNDDQLFEMIAGGGAAGTAAEAELMLRAKTEKTTVATFRTHMNDAAPKSKIVAINGLAMKKDKDSAGVTRHLRVLWLFGRPSAKFAYRRRSGKG